MIDIYMKSAMSKIICQDYIKKFQYSEYGDGAALSDGCSSSPDTHIGAMHIVETAAEWAMSRPFALAGITDKSLATEFIKEAYHLQNLNVGRRSYDATFMTLLEASGRIFVSVFGDGVIFWKNKDEGFIRITELEFTDNAPFYLSYFLTQKDHDIRKNMNSEIIQDIYFLKDGCLEPITHKTEPDSSYNLAFTKDEVDFIGIASDGITAIPKAQADVYTDLFQFKGKGEFTKRICNHTFKKYAKQGIFPKDDFSMAVWKPED